MTAAPKWLADVAARSTQDRVRSKDDPSFVFTQAMEDRRALLFYIETLQAEAAKLLSDAILFNHAEGPE